MAALALPPVDVSEAKARLSMLMTQALHEHAPVRVVRRGEEDQLVWLTRQQILDRLLAGENFSVEMTVESGEFVAAIPGLGQIGAGSSVDAALVDLRDAVDGFVTEFFTDLRFWEGTSRIAFYKPLLRYLLLDANERLRMLAGEDGAERLA